MPLINYTELNLFTINASEPRPKLASGKEDMEAICKTYSIQFLPGVNEVSDEAYAVMILHPVFESYVDAGKLVVLDEPKSKDGLRTVKEMLSIISSMYDVKLLKKIISTDDRSEVKEAARSQLEIISMPKGEQKGTGEHFK